MDSQIGHRRKKYKIDRMDDKKLESLLQSWLGGNVVSSRKRRRPTRSRSSSSSSSEGREKYNHRNMNKENRHHRHHHRGRQERRARKSHNKKRGRSSKIGTDAISCDDEIIEINSEDSEDEESQKYRESQQLKKSRPDSTHEEANLVIRKIAQTPPSESPKSSESEAKNIENYEKDAENFKEAVRNEEIVSADTSLNKVEKQSETIEENLGTMQTIEFTRKFNEKSAVISNQDSTEVCSNLVKTWKIIVNQGLSNETKAELLKKYSNENSHDFQAPILNQGLKSLLSGAEIIRDEAIISKQNQVGALIKAMELGVRSIVKMEKKSSDLVRIVEAMNDAAIIMGEVHYSASLARKTSVAEELTNEKLKFSGRVGEYLFSREEESEIEEKILKRISLEKIDEVVEKRLREAKEEAKRKAEEETKRKVEEEIKRKAEEEKKRKAEEEALKSRIKQAKIKMMKEAEEAIKQAKAEAMRNANEAIKVAKEVALKLAREEAVRKANEEIIKFREEAIKLAKEEAIRKADVEIKEAKEAAIKEAKEVAILIAKEEAIKFAKDETMRKEKEAEEETLKQTQVNEAEEEEMEEDEIEETPCSQRIGISKYSQRTLIRAKNENGKGVKSEKIKSEGRVKTEGGKSSVFVPNSDYPGTMEMIKMARMREGFPESAMPLLMKSTGYAPRTLTAYEKYMKMWWDFTKRESVDTFDPMLRDIMEFLIENFNNGASVSALKIARAALSNLLGDQVTNNYQLKKLFKSLN